MYQLTKHPSGSGGDSGLDGLSQQPRVYIAAAGAAGDDLAFLLACRDGIQMRDATSCELARYVGYYGRGVVLLVRCVGGMSGPTTLLKGVLVAPKYFDNEDEAQRKRG
eukprot:scaffold119962_cov81-Attheya_sp.AAC.1